MNVGARLVDAAVDHQLAEQPRAGRLDRLGIQRQFENVGRLHELGCAVAGDEIAVRIGGMAETDMPECIEHAFIGEHAIGDRQFLAGFSERIGHEYRSPFWDILRSDILGCHHPRRRMTQ
jgi:hypothetical protein